MPPPADDPFAMVVDDAPSDGRQPAILPDDGGLSFDFVEAPSQPAPAAHEAPSSAAARAPGSELLDFIDEPAASTPPAGKRGGRAPPVMGTAPPPPTMSPRDADEPLIPPEPGQKQGKKAKFASAPLGARMRARLGDTLDFAQALWRRPALVAVAVVGIALIVLTVFGVRAAGTPAGFFWRNRFFAPSATSAATAKVLGSGHGKLADGSFAGAREALGTAAQLFASAPKDEEAKAFFVLCASELKYSYGQGGADWDQAHRVVENIRGTGASQMRARGAFALASGDMVKARTLLASLGDQPGADLESVWLYSQALLRSGEAAHAAQVLDNALKGHDLPKLMLARGLVDAKRGNLKDAAAWFDKALTKAPGNGRAAIELADVKLASGDLDGAAGLLDRALGSDVRKTLDATEEARASMLRARLLSARHDAKGAEAAFDRAAVLDPTSLEVHAAYGAFRLKQRDYEKAAKQFDTALANADVPAAVLGNAALAYLGVNRWVEADKHAGEAVAKDAKDAHLLYVQARVTDVLGKGDDAAKLYDKALATKPDLAEALIAKGLLAIKKGEKDKAQANLELAMKAGTARRATDDEGLGELWLALGSPAQAKDAYAAALALDPEDPQAHGGLGRALAGMGDLKAARAELEQALRQTDTDAAMHYQYGSLLRQMGEGDNALAALQRAVQLDGKDARFHARLGAILVERGEFEKAEEQLKLATLSDDRYGEGWFFLARALAGEKKLSQAVDTMRKALELEPDNAELLYHLGLIYEQGQQVRDAVESFSKSIAKHPKSAAAYEHLGQNLMVENLYPEAVDAFKKAADLDPGRARLWALVGDAMQQSGDVDGAIANFSRAVKEDPELPGVWSKLGVAFKDKGCSGCKTRAVDSLKKATQVDVKDVTAWHELGYLFKDDGRRGEAIAAFRKYLEHKPDAVDAETIKDEIYYLQEESRRQP
jgi:tetratricopeptide (TPR) repeat protein